MFGILCNRGKKQEYAERLHNFLRLNISKRDMKIVVFTIPDMDFTDNTVSGTLVSGQGIENEKVSLPSVIFNFSAEKKKGDNKKLSYISTLKNVILVNGTNRFDQLMIMEILASSLLTKRYLFPFSTFRGKNSAVEFEEDKDCLVMPYMDSKDYRIMYIKSHSGNFEILQGSEVDKNCILKMLQDDVKCRQWIMLRVPELFMHDDSPHIIRVYLQKNSKGEWIVLCKRSPYKEIFQNVASMKNMSDASLRIIKYVNNFLPGFGNCFLDFVLDKEGIPYFIHFGGFDSDILFQCEDENITKNFCKNLQNQADFLQGIQKGD